MSSEQELHSLLARSQIDLAAIAKLLEETDPRGRVALTESIDAKAQARLLPLAELSPAAPASLGNRQEIPAPAHD